MDEPLLQHHGTLLLHLCSRILQHNREHFRLLEKVVHDISMRMLAPYVLPKQVTLHVIALQIDRAATISGNLDLREERLWCANNNASMRVQSRSHTY